MIKDIQIRLRSTIPIEREIIDYITSLGVKSGEPKRLLIDGFRANIQPNSLTSLSDSDTRTAHKETESQKELLEKPNKSATFGSLLRKRK